MFEPLEALIGYRFRDRGLLEHALTHRSRVHEDATGGVFDNESLEFLGDSILGFVVADMLFREFPQHNEGQKSKLRASIVSASSLARLGERIELGSFLILGRGEEKTGGRRKHALIADSYEALIAAIYLDGGLEPARTFIERQFEDLIADARHRGAEASFTEDYKSALQEWLQSHDLGLPVYRLVAEIGPAHRRRFEVEVLVRGEPIAKAEGKSKKSAAQAAARLALGKEERRRRNKKKNEGGRRFLSSSFFFFFFFFFFSSSFFFTQSISMIPQGLVRSVSPGVEPASAIAGSACGSRVST